jgi:hypothetical protein
VLHADYLWHPSVLTSSPELEIPWHVGIGGFAVSTPIGGGIGVRVPLGVDFDLHNVPLQFFADVALVVGVLPGTVIGVSPCVGGRYYF